MNVLHPTLLAAGLAAVALPVLIHLLLRRRYRPMPWAAMRFVRIAQRQQRRRRKIEQILLLVARCLLVAFIAAAVAHPYLGAAGTRGETTLVLLIDDSLPSGAAGPDGTADFERIRAAALEEIGRLAPASGDRVAVIAAASPPRALIAAPSFDLNAARAAVEGLRPADSAPDFSRSLSLASDALADAEGPVRVAILSTWRAGSLARAAGDPGDPRTPGLPGAAPGERARAAVDIVFAPPLDDDRANLRLRTLALTRGTLLIDDTPAARQVVASIDRTGPTDEEARGDLIPSIGDGAQGPPVPFVIPAGERSVSVSFELPALPQAGAGGEAPAVLTARLVSRAGADAIAPDSVRRVALRVADRVDAGVVRARGLATDEAAIPASAWIRAALRPDDRAPIRLRELAPGGVDEASLLGLDLVAIARPDLLTPAGWGALDAFADAGGTVVVFAPGTEGPHPWAEDAGIRFGALAGLATEAIDLTAPEPLTSGPGAADLPMLRAELGSLAGSVRVWRVLPIDAEAERVVLATAGGAPVVTRAGRGVWFVGVPASTAWSDLPARPLFVPLMQEIARRSPARTLALTLDAGAPFDATGVLDALADEETGQRVELRGAAPETAGVRSALDAGGQPLGLAAINADADAGDTTPTDRERVATELTPALEASFGGPQLRWLGDDDDGDDDQAIASSRLGPMAFALAAALAVLESLIGLGASRRGLPRTPAGGAS